MSDTGTEEIVVPDTGEAQSAGARAPELGAAWLSMSDTGTEEIVVPDTVEELLGGEDVRPDRLWIVIVWNDPVNLMTYVTYVFQKLFGYSRSKATRLMLQVHHEGRAVVASGTREKCEIDVQRLHAYGLWATMQQDD
jgi:ATP-dependent Clp protease adaptor protein ClpS